MGRWLDIIVVVLGGWVAAHGIARTLARLVTPDRPPRWVFAVYAANILAGVGLSFWIMAPTGGLRLLAFAAGVGGIVAASLLVIAHKNEGVRL